MRRSETRAPIKCRWIDKRYKPSFRQAADTVRRRLNNDWPSCLRSGPGCRVVSKTPSHISVTTGASSGSANVYVESFNRESHVEYLNENYCVNLADARQSAPLLVRRSSPERDRWQAA